MSTLLYSLASPYARAPRVAIRYLRIDNINEVIANPFENPGRLADANPLAKIPCLIFDDKRPVFDSEVILRYLDATHGGNKLFGQEHSWERATDFSMVKGLMDSAVGLRQEQMREDEGVRSPFWTQRFESAILRTARHIESVKPRLFESGELTAERLVLVCALSYADFRFPRLGWRSGAPNLADWINEQLTRPWFKETHPK